MSGARPQPDRLFTEFDGVIARARARGAEQVEVSFMDSQSGPTRFANSYLTQTAVIAEPTARIRVSLGARVGAAITSSLDADALDACAAQALDMARVMPPSESFVGFASAADAQGTASAAAGYVEATAAYSHAERADTLARVFAAAQRRDLVCAGVFRSGVRELAVVTSEGARQHHAFTSVSLSLIAHDAGDRDASGHAAFLGRDVGALDADALCERAVAKAARSRTRVRREPGRMDVVLAPAALAELLEWMSFTSFSARSLIDEMSWLSGRAGEPACDARVSIGDDWQLDVPGALPVPFDAEGMPRQRVLFVDQGRAGVPFSDRQTAHKLESGARSTGHAAAVCEDSADGPQAGHVFFAPGEDSVDDLVARVDNGLYVTRFHYVNGLLDTKRATMTGMTRDGTFAIEGGKLGGAVENLRFTDSILDALSRVGGIGREVQMVPSWWSNAGYLVCPHVLLRDFHFTGTSRS